ncbi:hypothetical protein [Vibrio sp. B1Z05]|uniref:hypothetical protein n=1 Tax=Vibrio sp. B1Z05 TaxID=2654980 RepID=UPI001327ADF6|nr:hypothetical protein [Vibrio sp. B1Z05]MPW36311.1 hypothetical protein [Vibrio sp. B1Z05]
MPEKITQQIIELNFCKNPLCADFGSLNAANYSILSERNNPQIACASCHNISPIIWPDELQSELSSQREYLQAGLTACTNKACDNLGYNVQLYPEKYYSFGFSGDKQRYRCKSCQKTVVDRFSVANPNLKTHVTILALLLTGFSLKEISIKLQMQAKTLNDHIKAMAAICRHKSSVFDHHWQNQSQQYLLGSDYHYLQPNSENGVLWICTLDLNSHYVVHQSVNISEQANVSGNRIIAREYLASINTPLSEPASDKLADIIMARLNDHSARSHRNNPLHNQTQLNYPVKTSLVTPIYCATAHYHQINQWFQDMDKLTLSLAFEPMLAEAAITSFNGMRQKQSLDLLYQIDDPAWVEGRMGSKPQPLIFAHNKVSWSLSEQKHIRANTEQRAICQIIESNLTQKQVHQLPKHTPISNYMERFHVIFKSSVNEPRRKRRPEGLLPLLDIYKAWNNLCHQNNPGETPAVNAGISEKPLSLDQLLQ